MYLYLFMMIHIYTCLFYSAWNNIEYRHTHLLATRMHAIFVWSRVMPLYYYCSILIITRFVCNEF